MIRHLILITTVLLAMMPASCNNENTRIRTVGVINVVPDLVQVFEGFKEGMVELGYIEGKNIRYLYDGPTTDMSKLSDTARSLVTSDADLILSITTPATKAVKQATTGTGFPVVFVVVTDPVGAGIVESMQHPGGNITGVVFGLQEARRLEWLVRIAPGIRHIYVPFNPEDQSPVLALETVSKAAAKLGVNLITREVRNPEMLENAIVNIPDEADATFFLPDSLVSTRLPDMVAASVKRNLPTSVVNVSVIKNNLVLTSFGFDQRLYGRQSARLADQIFKGVPPADLPVETAEFYLAVNLKAARTIGLTIPEEILRQADYIIR